MGKSGGKNSGQRLKYLLTLAGILDVFFQVAVGCLDFAIALLYLSFQLQIVVADEIAGDLAAQLFFCKNFRAMPSGWMSQSSRLR